MSLGNSKCWKNDVDLAITHKVRGVVAISLGDLFLVTGSFQVHMQHRALSKLKAMQPIVDIRQRYRAMDNEAVRSMDRLQVALREADRAPGAWL